MRQQTLVAIVLIGLSLVTGCGGGSGVDLATPPTSAVNGTPATPPAAATVNDMSSARAEHTATLLGDGRVLIAGGYAAGSTTLSTALASAEIYDPATAAFTPTGSMHTARARHTATRLADGRVLIAGGQADTNVLQFIASAEIYDPATGTFTPTGDMVAGGFTWSAFLLQDGRVFLAEDGNAELYDPTTGRFALAASYVTAAAQMDRGALLSSGKVLVVGYAMHGGVAPFSEIYDPRNDTFTATAPWRGASGISTATLLEDGTVLYVEGNDEAFSDDVELYDPNAGTFTYIGHTISSHEFSTATRMGDGTVLIAGGQLPGGNGSDAVEIYSPQSRTFVLARRLSSGRHSHIATLLADGSVLMTGGYTIWPLPTASAELH